VSARYVPAAGRAWLTRAYDPVIGLTMRESRWRPAVTVLALDAGRDVVDVGAGTGRQALPLAAAGARVVAVDGDPAALSLAQRKKGVRPLSCTWRTGLADALPVETGSVDAVVMALLLHHLDARGKRIALREAGRVLRPGGRLVVADWGPPRGLLPSVGFRVLRAVDGAAGLDDHRAGRLLDYIRDARFTALERHNRLPTAWGTLEIWTARRPAS
jgi:ubiquinone/menaquinone biosynthesis C-methylase UbiE